MSELKNIYTLADFLETCAVGAPKFNADDSLLVYASNASGVTQTHAIPTLGGNSVQLTNYPDAIAEHHCSPADKNLFIFLKAVNGNERDQIYLMDVSTKKVECLSQSTQSRYYFGGWSRDGMHIAYSSNERDGKDFDVYVMNIKTREITCICKDGGRWFSVGFSPLGTFITLQYESSNVDNDLYLYNMLTNTREHVTLHKNTAHFGVPQWLPDESGFFVTSNHEREYVALFRYTLANKQSVIAYAPSWDVLGTRISRNGTHLAVYVNENGYKKATVLKIDGASLESRPHSLCFEQVYPVSFSSDGALLTCVCSSSCQTTSIYVLNVHTGEATCVVENEQKVSQEILVKPELIQISSFDRLTIPVFVYRPHTKTGRLPAILYIHGGPESQFSPVFLPQIQHLVYEGYAVIAPNIRGSTGYGKTYVSLDDKEKRFDAIRDVIAVRTHIATRNDIDENKIVVMGGSYGGFTTLACLAFYPNLWAAGISQVGIANFVTFLQNTAPYRRALREAEYGSLEHDRALLESLSPIHKAQDIRAPLLLIHGSSDPRVPLSEAEYMKKEIEKHNGVVELVVYSDEGHGISKRQNRIDAATRIKTFLERVL